MNHALTWLSVNEASQPVARGVHRPACTVRAALRSPPARLVTQGADDRRERTGCN